MTLPTPSRSTTLLVLEWQYHAWKEAGSELTMTTVVENMRVHFYGVQGSGSVFPSRSERKAISEQRELELLDHVFTDLGRYTDSSGRLSCTIDDILGGPPIQETLLRYRSRFDMPEARVYGGWTTCIRVETGDGYELVFDCGSGFRLCARDLQGTGQEQDNGTRHLYLFGSHSHLDHTEGFDQAAICFERRNTVHVYGNRNFLRALDQNLGIFTREVDENLLGLQTPMHYGKMKATFEACEIRDLAAKPPPADDRLADRHLDLGDTIKIGRTSIRTIEVCHPAPCLAYRLEHGGKVFVLCTDHELFHGDDSDPRHAESRVAEERLMELSSDADLLYRDGQFLRSEYDGREGIGTGPAFPRIGWGHSCIEDVIDMAIHCSVKQTHIGHHDPNRDWSGRTWIDETLARHSDRTGLRFELAQAETFIDL